MDLVLRVLRRYITKSGYARIFSPNNTTLQGNSFVRYSYNLLVTILFTENSLCRLSKRKTAIKVTSYNIVIMYHK